MFRGVAVACGAFWVLSPIVVGCGALSSATKFRAWLQRERSGRSVCKTAMMVSRRNGNQYDRHFVSVGNTLQFVMQEPLVRLGVEESGQPGGGGPAEGMT